MHADDHYHDLKNYVSSLGKHSHICMFYNDREQQITALAEYFKSGLRLGQQCIYISDQSTAQFVRNVMVRAGMDVEADIEDGSMRFLTPEQTYLSGGKFDSDVVMGLIEMLIADAYAAGFNGLRGAADAAWMLNADVTALEILQYESKVNRLFEQFPLMGLCQYDANRFTDETLKLLMKTHPTILKGGEVVRNPGYTPPAEFMPMLEAESDLKLAV